MKKDFQFIGVDMDEEEIIATPKSIYKAKIKKLVTRAAFQEYLSQKEGKKKLDDIKYDCFSIQPYLKSAEFSVKERELLYSLRSRSHEAKINYRKMNKNSLKCIFQCPSDEDQRHIFTNCEALKSSQNRDNVRYEDIFCTERKQKQAISLFLMTENRRNTLKEKQVSQQTNTYLGGICQDPC